MIVFMVPGASPDQIGTVESLLKEKDLFGGSTQFDGTSVVVAVDHTNGEHPHDAKIRKELEILPGVEKTLVIPEPYQLASRKIRKERTVVQTGPLSLGNGTFGIIAGPCSVETEKQTLQCAHAVKKAGANALRGGAYKPRTSPYVFRGLKEKGLKILAKAREETGLAIVTEVMSPEKVPQIEQYADVLQIGARNSQNFALLEAVGNSRKPVLLKRGFCSTLEEFLMSAEYILAGGNQNVILCERGIRTFENFTRFTPSIAIIPELRIRTHLPIIVDPSHAAGKSYFVGPISAAATAAGADGLLVEVHPQPRNALCDGRQSLTVEEFEQLSLQCREIASIVQRGTT